MTTAGSICLTTSTFSQAADMARYTSESRAICTLVLSNTDLVWVRCLSENYQVHRLVYVETYEHAEDAIRREKQLKKWKREWKIQLIEQDNLEWRDLLRFDRVIGTSEFKTPSSNIRPWFLRCPKSIGHGI